TYNGVAARRGQGATMMCPGLGGGKNWQPAAFSEITGMLYVSAAEGCQNQMTAEVAPEPTVTGGDFDLTSAVGWRGRGVAPIDQRPEMPDGAEDLAFSLVAIDAATGETTAKALIDIRAQGVLATAGDLIFTSDRAGFLTAYDPVTLDQVWQQNVGTALYGPPISYAYEGRQYVAVLAGGAGNGGDDPAVSSFVPSDALYVCALPETVASAQ